MTTGTLALLPEPAATWLHHLVVLLALALSLSLATAFGRRRRTPAVTRWQRACRVALALNLTLAAASLVDALAFDIDTLPLPPLSAFVSLATAAILGWALTSSSPARGVDRALGLGLIAAALALLASAAVRWMAPATLGAPLPIEIGWAAAGLLTVLALTLTLLLRRPAAWTTAGLAFGLLLAGFGLRLSSLLWAGGQGPLAGALWLAELAAYPLLALAAAGALVHEHLSSEAPDREPRIAAEAVRRAPQIDLLREAMRLASAETSDDLARRAPRAAAQALRAEYCVLLTPPEPQDQFAIAYAYDLISEQYLVGVGLDEASAPVISAALAQRRALILPARSRSPDMHSLQTALGLDIPGPALLAPLVAGDRLLGGLLILSPYARRDFTAEDREALEIVAAHVAERMGRLQRAEAAGGPPLDLGAGVVLLDDGTPSPAPPAQDLTVLLDQNQQARETIDILEAEIERLKAAQAAPLSGTAEEAEALAGELQRVLQDLAEARARLAALQAGGATPALAPLDTEAIETLLQELRTPLDSALDYSDLVLGESIGPLVALQRRFVERIRASLQRIGILVSDLTRLTASDLRAFSVDPRPMDLLECLDRALMLVDAALRAGGQVLRSDIPPGLPPAFADPEAMMQVLAHLLQNAAGVSPEGGEILVTAQLQQPAVEGDPGCVVLSVTDTGEGIPPEDLGRVFQRPRVSGAVLVRGIADTSGNLALVRAMVEAQRGRVWVDSQLGHGSTFTVLLPAAAPEAPPVSRPEPVA